MYLNNKIKLFIKLNKFSLIVYMKFSIHNVQKETSLNFWKLKIRLHIKQE